MAIRKSSLMYIVIALFVIVGVGTIYAAWRISNGLPIIPGESDAGSQCDVVQSQSCLDCLVQANTQTCVNNGSCTCVTPESPDPTPVCGDGTCSSTESCNGCSEDCGSCAGGGSSSGDDDGGDDGDGDDDNDGEAGNGSCGAACNTSADCDGPNPICTESGTCYDAQSCGDGDDGGSSSGDGDGDDARGRTLCSDLDDSKNADGNSSFEITQGQALDITLYTDIEKINGGEVDRYRYELATGMGKLNPKGNTNKNSTKWKLTPEETLDLEPGVYEAVAASVKDSKGKTTGGFTDDSTCIVTLEVAAPSSAVVLSETASTSCSDDESTATTTYTVTMRNVTDEDAMVEELVVELDSGIDEDMVSDISDDGDISGNTITWDNDITIDANGSETVTYDIIFDDSEFDNYENTISASLSDGEQPDDATSSTTISCELPETAIINDWADRLLLAVGLLIAGFIVLRFDVFNLVNLKEIAEGRRASSKKKFEEETLGDN